MSEWAFSSATELTAALRERRIGAVELLEMYLARVDRYNERVNALIVLDRDGALERARAADEAIARGEVWGPLHGLPMTVKESYDVAGMPSTHGVPDLAENVAERHSLAVQRLENAGAIIFGKSNVPLRLADFQSYNDVYGKTNNPFDLTRTPGGSSGGSAAALATGLVGLESGSDIGGSIRNPAHFCGVFGHKPTWNLLPPRGHALPGVLAPPDIAVIGPLARSADDLELALEVLAGPNEIERRGFSFHLSKSDKSIAEMKVAVWANDSFAPVSRAVEQRVRAVADTFAAAGATVDDSARPEFSAEHSHDVYQRLLQPVMSSRIPQDEFDGLVRRTEELDPNDDSPRAATLRAQTLRHRDWLQANEERTHLRWAWHRFFQEWDLLLTPMMATSAFPHDHQPFGKRTISVDGEARPYFEQLFWAGLTGVSLLPSTVVPSGLDDDGLPIGVQVAGPEYGDLMTIEAAQFLEAEGYRFQPPSGYQD